MDAANGHLSSKGLYTTDANGEIRVSVTGTVVIKETKCLPGYTMDLGTQTQTVTVNPADTQTITVYNTPGVTLTIQKYVDGTTDPIQHDYPIPLRSKPSECKPRACSLAISSSREQK